MNVQIGLLIKVGRDPELLRSVAHDRQRRLDRLVHDFAELAGRRRLALARQRHCLDRKEVASDLGDVVDVSGFDVGGHTERTATANRHGNYFHVFVRRCHDGEPAPCLFHDVSSSGIIRSYAAG